MKKRAAFRPSSYLLNYQKPVYADGSRFIAWCASRQVGKSFVGAARAVRHALSHPRTDYLIASPTLRQSLEAARKCREIWSHAFAVGLGLADEELFSASATTISFKNGSRIIAVPGAPDNVRGFSGSIWLDEFAFFEDPERTWTALLPTITSALGADKQKSVFITSTPNGISGHGARFYEIMSGEDPLWSLHTTTITEAAPETGLDINILRDSMGSDDAFAQEYLCQFIDNVSVLLPYEVISSAQSDEASVESPLESLGGRVYVGIDFGRVGDPSAVWTLEQVGDTLITREVLTLKGMDTMAQERIISSRVERASVACMDYTGPGIGLGDMLAAKHGEYAPEHHHFGKVELLTFSNSLKCEIFPRLRRVFDSHRIRIPADGEIENDLHEMRQTITNGGAITYSARRTSEGHADRCVALALAVRAAEHGAERGTTIRPRAFGRMVSAFDRSI